MTDVLDWLTFLEKPYPAWQPEEVSHTNPQQQLKLAKGRHKRSAKTAEERAINWPDLESPGPYLWHSPLTGEELVSGHAHVTSEAHRTILQRDVKAFMMAGLMTGVHENRVTYWPEHHKPLLNEG